MISVRLQGKNSTIIHVYAATSNAEEAEVERFYEDLQDLLELTPRKDVLFIIGDWNAKVGSQETPGVTGKFGLGIWNEVRDILQETGIKTIPMEKKCKKAKWLSAEALQIAVKRGKKQSRKGKM